MSVTEQRYKAVLAVMADGRTVGGEAQTIATGAVVGTLVVAVAKLMLNTSV